MDGVTGVLMSTNPDHSLPNLGEGWLVV